MSTETAAKRKKNKVIQYFLKFKGAKKGRTIFLHNPVDFVVTFSGIFASLSILGYVTFSYHAPILIAPFGASAALLFGIPEAAYSQPRNVILGHTISASIGVLTYQLLGMTWWSVALGTSCAIIAMFLMESVHPPGGATAMLAILSGAHPIYILTPVLLGSLIMVVIACLINNLSPNRTYPKFWF